MKRPTATHVQSAILGGAVMIALIGGGYAAKELLVSGAATTTASDQAGVLQARARAQSGAATTPYFGPFALHKRDGKQCGPAVRLMEGALRNTKPVIRKEVARNCIGPATEKQIKTFQRRHNIRPTGIYGLKTHRALSSHYSREARNDLHYIARIQYVRKVRSTILVVTSHLRLVGGCCQRYTQSGQRGDFPSWPSIPSGTDCSGEVTWIAWQSGFGAALGYYGRGSPVGWTGTLAHQGRAVANNGPLQIGDLVLYGRFPFGHVAMYIGHGNVISHGSTGVKILPYNYRAVGQVRRYF
jgi:hypothetical protein